MSSSSYEQIPLGKLLGPTAIAKRVGRSQGHVVHHLALFRLPEEHAGRQAVARGEGSVERALGYVSETRCPTCGHLVRRKAGLKVPA